VLQKRKLGTTMEPARAQSAPARARTQGFALNQQSQSQAAFSTPVQMELVPPAATSRRQSGLKVITTHSAMQPAVQRSRQPILAQRRRSEPEPAALTQMSISPTIQLMAPEPQMQHAMPVHRPEVALAQMPRPATVQVFAQEQPQQRVMPVQSVQPAQFVQAPAARQGAMALAQVSNGVGTSLAEQTGHMGSSDIHVVMAANSPPQLDEEEDIAPSADNEDSSRAGSASSANEDSEATSREDSRGQYADNDDLESILLQQSSRVRVSGDAVELGAQTSPQVAPVARTQPAVARRQ